MKPRQVVALLPTGFGINCERETKAALESCGARVRDLHLNDLTTNPAEFAQAQILVLSGGFSFGDRLGSGRILANRLRHRLGGEIGRFVADGGLILGICNGFQTLVCMGLIPTGTLGRQVISLTRNASGVFHDGWVHLRAQADSPCVYTRGIEQMELCVRHGEGRLIAKEQTLSILVQERLIALRYVDPLTGKDAHEFPHNPNGSTHGAAGVCDPSGRIFGLMPHPEAFLHAENHPDWRRRKKRVDGPLIFHNAVKEAREIF